MNTAISSQPGSLLTVMPKDGEQFQVWSPTTGSLGTFVATSYITEDGILQTEAYAEGLPDATFDPTIKVRDEKGREFRGGGPLIDEGDCIRIHLGSTFFCYKL